MYRKQIYNLDFRYSDDIEGTKISIRQQSRFDRSCRSVFNNRSQKSTSSNPAISRIDQLRLSKQHRFLFERSQHINKPVMHLKYKKCSTRFDPTLYNFPIPYHLDRVQAREHVMVNAPVILQTDDKEIDMEITPAIEDSLAGPSDSKLHDNGLSWHASLGMLIPDELLPYVNDPVYVSKTQER
ncbi:hypothetical protein RhiirC2_835279, partial [Rhizophagus irregularis]